MLVESSLLTTKKILAECIEPFQLLQAKNVLPHLLIGKALGGCGLPAALESALLTIEKILAKANQLFYLFELKKAFLQVFGEARAFSIGLGVIRLYWTPLLFLTKKLANASQVLQPLKATDEQLTAKMDEPLEQTVATLGFEKLALDLRKLLLDLEVASLGLR